MARRVRTRARPRRVPRRIGMFLPARHRYLSKIITFRSITGAKKAIEILREMYYKAKTRQKKLTILRAVVLAANRAKVAAERHPSFSPEVRRRWKRISQIYRDLAEELKSDYAWTYHRVESKGPEMRRIFKNVPRSIANWRYKFSFSSSNEQYVCSICQHPTKPIIAIYNEGEGVLYASYRNDVEVLEALTLLHELSERTELGKEALSYMGLRRVPSAPSLNWFEKVLQALTAPRSVKIER